MSQSQSQNAYRSGALREGYAEAKRKAREALSASSHRTTCANEQNLLLILFLKEARDWMQTSGSDTLAKAYHRGAKNLERHPLRVYNKDRLLEVSGFGPATTSVIEKHLWSDPECKPASPSAEEKQVEKRHFEQKHTDELAQKAAEKQRKAAERAAKKREGPASRASQPVPNTTATAGLSGLPLLQAASSFQGEARPEPQPRQKKQRTASKEYVPGVGTSNYALLIALFQAQRQGEPFLTKHDLLDRADALHITSKPLKGNPSAPVAPGMFTYDGWSCFIQLTNREPPLAQVYSNPKKARLTPEGEVLARKLYLDAVQRQSIVGNAEILDYIRRAEPSAVDMTKGMPPAGPIAQAAPRQAAAEQGQQAHCGGRSGETPSGAVPGFGSSMHTSLQPGAPALHMQQKATEERWDFSDEETRPTLQDQQRCAGHPADMAQLLEMGFTPEQASKGLHGGRSIAEAVEIITLSDSEGEEEVGRNALNAALMASQQDCIHQNGSTSCPGQHPPAAPQLQPASITRIVSVAEATSLPSRAESLPSAAAGGLHASLPAFLANGPATLQASQSGSQASSQATAGRMQAGLEGFLGQSRQHHSQSRLQAAWRLQGVAEHGFAGETGIRLPPLDPQQRFGDRYQVCLLLDSREHFGSHLGNRRAEGAGGRNAPAMRQLAALGVNVQSKAMEVGDALWAAQPLDGGPCYVLDTIVERKRVDDLVSSIKSGRYERQRYFLARCGMRRTLYLLEGDVDLTTQGPMAKACKTAMHRLEVEDGFRVLRTPDSAHTIRLYHQITLSLQDKYQNLRKDSQEAAQGLESLLTLGELEARLKLAKQVTLRDIWGLMLCAVPRISSETCETILREYPTPFLLWKAYRAAIQEALAKRQDAVAAANGLLMSLRGIGPDTSRSVFCCLFANGWQV